ncbi:MAG: hypothetical protein GX567_08915 [Clostridia bacterium]|nr:hypothetical protein [Clostridia bacterium]
MGKDRPEILIGVTNVTTSKQIKKTVSEIIFGIEEEGCLYDIYDAMNIKDIRYSSIGICVIVSEKIAIIYDNDLGEANPFYTVEINYSGYSIENLRTLGKNAARYIKQNTLYIK